MWRDVDRGGGMLKMWRDIERGGGVLKDVEGC